MPDNKDELLKQQNEEIQKLKKELKAATKPSSMLSVLKSTVRRNVHDFFIREDKIKSVQEENKKLKKELEETKEERDKTSAQLFAAINLCSDNQGHRLKKKELLMILAMHRFFHKPQKKQSGNISDRLTLLLLQGNYIRTRACSVRILSQKVQRLQK